MCEGLRNESSKEKTPFWNILLVVICFIFAYMEDAVIFCFKALEIVPRRDNEAPKS